MLIAAAGPARTNANTTKQSNSLTKRIAKLLPRGALHRGLVEEVKPISILTHVLLMFAGETARKKPHTLSLGNPSNGVYGLIGFASGAKLDLNAKMVVLGKGNSL